MGGLGMVLGGALQGIGQGMAMQAKDDLETRRSTALENLRSQNDSARAVQTADLSDRNAARQTARTTDSTIAVNKVQAETTAQRDARLNAMEQSNIRLRGAIDSAQQSASAQAKAEADQAEREFKSGEVKDIIPGKDGFYYKVTTRGVEVKTNIPVAPKDLNGSGGGFAMGELGGAPAAPAPKKIPGTPPVTKPVIRPPLDSFNQ